MKHLNLAKKTKLQATLDKGLGTKSLRFDQVFPAQTLPAGLARQRMWTLADVMPDKWPVMERPVQQRIEHAPSHTRRIFSPYELRNIAEGAARVVRERRIEALLCCGHSGLILAGAVSMLCDVQIFAARKAGDTPVAGSQGLEINGIAPKGPVRRWAWIDDHISSGGTFQRSRHLAKKARLIATGIPETFIFYESDGCYIVTEDGFVGYHSPYSLDPLEPGQHLISSVKV